jgi:hypothetical protein
MTVEDKRDNVTGDNVIDTYKERERKKENEEMTKIEKQTFHDAIFIRIHSFRILKVCTTNYGWLLIINSFIVLKIA